MGQKRTCHGHRQTAAFYPKEDIGHRCAPNETRASFDVRWQTRAIPSPTKRASLRYVLGSPSPSPEPAPSSAQAEPAMMRSLKHRAKGKRRLLRAASAIPQHGKIAAEKRPSRVGGYP